MTNSSAAAPAKPAPAMPSPEQLDLDSRLSTPELQAIDHENFLGADRQEAQAPDAFPEIDLEDPFLLRSDEQNRPQVDFADHPLDDAELGSDFGPLPIESQEKVSYLGPMDEALEVPRGHLPDEPEMISSVPSQRRADPPIEESDYPFGYVPNNAEMQDQGYTEEQLLGTGADDFTYRTSQSDDDDGVIADAGDDVAAPQDPDASGEEIADQGLWVEPDESRRRRLSSQSGGLGRAIAPYALAGVFLVIGGGLIYVTISPVIKGIFGGHPVQAPYVNVAASTPPLQVPPPTVTPPAPAAPSTVSPQQTALQAVPAQQAAPASSATPPGSTQRPPPAAVITALNNQVTSLEQQIASLQKSLSDATNQINSENAELQSVETDAKLSSDKNSASIALLENNVLTLQSALQSLQQASKPTETAELPVPSNDTNDPNSGDIIAGFDLRGVSATAAVVKSPSGLATYNLGQEIPGAGIATGWQRWNGTWELITTEGVIRPAETGN